MLRFNQWRNFVSLSRNLLTTKWNILISGQCKRAALARKGTVSFSYDPSKKECHLSETKCTEMITEDSQKAFKGCIILGTNSRKAKIPIKFVKLSLDSNQPKLESDGHLYYLTPEKLTFVSGRSSCENLGLRLAQIISETQLKILEFYYRESGVLGTWVGLEKDSTPQLVPRWGGDGGKAGSPSDYLSSVTLYNNLGLSKPCYK